MNNENYTEQLNHFLQDEKQTLLTIKYEKHSYTILFYKLNLGIFTYIYYLTFHDSPEFRDEANLCGVIHNKTNQLYFAGYNIREFFEHNNPSQIKLNNISKEELQSKYYEDINHAYIELAKIITEEKIPEEYEIDDIKHNAIKEYFYEDVERNKTYEYEVELNKLLEYIKNPQEAIKNEMLKRENNEYTQSRPSERIKKENLIKRVTRETLNEITNTNKYEPLKLAKQIKDICKDKKQVTIYYKTIKTNEILIGKLNTEVFKYLPYHLQDDLYFDTYYLDSETRNKIKEIDGYEYNNIYVKNIIKLEYRNKPIYEYKGEQK